MLLLAQKPLTTAKVTNQITNCIGLYYPPKVKIFSYLVYHNTPKRTILLTPSAATEKPFRLLPKEKAVLKKHLNLTSSEASFSHGKAQWPVPPLNSYST